MNVCPTIGSIKTVGSLADAVYESYVRTNERLDNDPIWKKRVLSNRKKVASQIKKFHKDSGTLTFGVREKLAILRSKEDCIFLMSAHQTNFVPYSGVVRKTTLMHAVKEKLARLSGVEVVEFYGVANQDIASSWPWLKMTQFPSIFHKNGVFELSYEMKKEYEMKMHAAVPNPDWSDILKWGCDTREWMKVCLNYIENSGCNVEPDSKNELYRNYERFMGIFKESRESARNFAEFNAIVLSKIVNNHFCHDTLFSLFTDCQKVLDKEFLFLLENYRKYYSCLADINGIQKQDMIAPFWYHCECLGKVKLRIMEDEDVLKLSGKCPACGKVHSFALSKDNMAADFSMISKHISARARPMTLVFFEGLGANMYVGGALAGKCYLKEARHIAGNMKLNFPPIAVWRPRDRYCGLGQFSCELFEKSACDGRNLEDTIYCLESEINMINERISAINALIKRTTSMHERNKLIAEKNSIRKEHDMRMYSKKLSDLKKVSNTQSVIPSIMDYAINIGLERTRDGWYDHLMNNGNLEEDIILDSVLKYRGKKYDTQ
ncbi:MAG: hypothetical protein U9Q92_05650 [archaeon]|nr:hypothetical protein [archaeon]